MTDKTIEELKEENERLQMICAAAYQMAGVADAPVRFLDALSNPLEMAQEQIDALLPITPNEFKNENIKTIEKLDRQILSLKEQLEKALEQRT
jgi:hypothetical protein